MAKDKPPSRGPKIPDDVNAPSSGGKRKPSAKGRKTKAKSQQKRGGLDPIVCIGIGAALVAGVFSMTNLPSVSVWAWLGVQMKRILGTGRLLRAFNITMALLLVATLIPLLQG